MAGVNGRHALVTGGGRGIGRAVAAALASAGAQVTIMGRDEAALAQAVTAGAAQRYIVADVTDVAAVRDGVVRAASHGTIDILVANAGGVETAPFARTSPEAFRRMFEVNTLGVVHATQAVLAAMTERQHGRIVAVASTAGLKGYAYVSAYCAAKHAVVGLVRALALETARTGVTVNAICPGYTDTELVRASIDGIVTRTGRTKDDVVHVMLKDAPLGRLVKPDEVAAAALFLCSDEASAITGTTIAVAGGEV